MEKEKIAGQLVDCWLDQKSHFKTDEDAYESLKTSIAQALDVDIAPTSLIITKAGHSTLLKINGETSDLIQMLAQIIIREPSGSLRRLFQDSIKAADLFITIKNSQHQA